MVGVPMRLAPGDVKTTLICTHVLNHGPGRVQGPVDSCGHREGFHADPHRAS
jgi:hypothetical protein